jgi:endonuclease III
MTPEQLADRVLSWYAAHGRDLPWRHTRDPYAVLVSEVMLQQTQVDRVIERWTAWLKRWPTAADLAAATRADVIAAWQGLGYNRRAVSLHEAARVLADEGINIQMISTSTIRISVVTSATDLDKAARALHTAFGLDSGQAYSAPLPERK